MRPRGWSIETAPLDGRMARRARSDSVSNDVKKTRLRCERQTHRPEIESQSVKHLVGFLLSTLACAACGDGSPSSGTDAGSAVGPDASVAMGSRLAAPIKPAAACDVTIDAPVFLPGVHVPEGTLITWNSNPPSSGTHFPVWAAYQVHKVAVGRGYTVHDLEHGAVVLSYKCDPGPACDAIVAGLRAVRDSIPTDPLCTSSVRVRVVVVPDPLLDAPVAAATWGWTYNAQCLDLPSLKDFANAHYRQSPEDACENGRMFE